MTDFILLLIIGTAWIWGVHCLFTENYILGEVGKNLWTKAPRWICKPLFACPPCMASLHGLLFGSCYFGWPFGWPFNEVPGYMICLCGLNFILKQLIYPEYE